MLHTLHSTTLYYTTLRLGAGLADYHAEHRGEVVGLNTYSRVRGETYMKSFGIRSTLAVGRSTPGHSYHARKERWN